MRARVAITAGAAAVVVLGAVAGWPVSVPAGRTAAADDPVLLAAGDIAACDTTGDETTAAILDANPQGTIAVLGDLAYPDGTLSQFQSCYGPTWGRHKARTLPAVGNHEYHTNGAAGYFDYFGAAAGERTKGYYSYDLGAWHVIVLNSNCNRVPCNAGSAQEQWLRADLAAHPTDCTLAYWHHPRFSSGQHGSDGNVAALWAALYSAGAEIVLSGHDHLYERFEPQTPAAIADPTNGLRQFVVGTGGRGHYSFVTTTPNSAVRHTGTFGILKLVLRPGSYDWQFLPEAGKTFTDAGSGSCHGSSDGGPPVNPTLSSTHGSAWSSDRTVDVTWSGASDSGSNVDGFSYEWTQSATSVPDTTKDAEEAASAVTSPSLADGQWWFHLRTRDNAGNWSTPMQLGPFQIDGTAPANPAVSSSSHAAGDWSNDQTVDVAWAAAADTGSGPDGYSYVWSQDPLTVPALAKTAEEGPAVLTSQPLADGQWWFHLRTVDNAGNWSTPVHVGPFGIDTLALPTPTLGTTSHELEVWSSANTVVVEWSGPPGADGYSYEWSNAPQTTPDTTIDAAATETTTSDVRPDGSSWFHLRALDAATGGWTRPVHIGPFLIDTTAPETVMIGEPPRIELFASEPATFRCSLNGAPFAGCSPSLTLGPQGPGEHVLSAVGVDRAGNVDATPARQHWTVAADLPLPPPPPAITPPRPATARCVVPRLTGRTLSRSRALLARAGCRLGRVSRAYSARIARGHVVNQRPRAGLRLRRGASVAVTVSRGRR